MARFHVHSAIAKTYLALGCAVSLSVAVPLGNATAAEMGYIASEDLSVTQAALKEVLASGNSDSKSVSKFYASRNFRPVWTDEPSARAAARRARAALNDAAQHGLDASAYMTPALQRADDPAPGRPSALQDVALTQAVLKYVRDVQTGRLRPNRIYKDIDLPARDFDEASALAAALETDSLDTFLANPGPAHPAYRRLVTALARYRSIEAKGGWPRVPSGELNQTQSNAALIARLRAEDSSLSGLPLPGDALQQAIKRYQLRNGLKADGNLGPETIAALNVPVGTRIQQIAANMERWRWMPAEFERRHVEVNVPGQTMDFIEDGRTLLTSRVMVGRKGSPSPILRTEAHALVVNPPWNVPGDIAGRQILPNLKRDPNYLASRNMILVNGPEGDRYGRTINWREVSATQFPYHIRQLPGPGSAMGAIMIDAPNRFDVYLHDTPGKKFFENDDRTLSNGCIRVQDMMQLASLTLSGDDAMDERELSQTIASRTTRRIPLDEHLPIYMAYWTAVADADGAVRFFPDRYNRDAPLISALSSRSSSKDDSR